MNKNQSEDNAAVEKDGEIESGDEQPGDVASQSPEMPGKAPRAPKGKGVPTLRYAEVTGILNNMAGRAVDGGDYGLLSQILENTISSSVFINKVACLKSYGVLTANDKEKAWTLTELGKRIAYPRSEDDQLLAEQMSFAQYPLLNTIWTFYKGKPLTEEHVSNAIEAYCGVPPFLKKEWADYFIEAVRNVKLTYTVSGQERVAENFTRTSKMGGESGGTRSPDEIEKEKNQKRERERPEKPPAEAIDELAKLLTKGMKLSRRAGEAYLLFYVEETLTDEDANEIGRALTAAQAILDLYRPKK